MKGVQWLNHNKVGSIYWAFVKTFFEYPVSIIFGEGFDQVRNS